MAIPGGLLAAISRRLSKQTPAIVKGASVTVVKESVARVTKGNPGIAKASSASVAPKKNSIVTEIDAQFTEFERCLPIATKAVSDKIANIRERLADLAGAEENQTMLVSLFYECVDCNDLYIAAENALTEIDNKILSLPTEQQVEVDARYQAAKKSLETSCKDPITALKADLRKSCEAVGIEFSNGGLPGPRLPSYRM